MSLFLSILLTFFQQYGYPALGVSIFVAAIGLPLPISLVLLAAGAFAALGDFNIILLAVIATSASVAGDSVGYLIGRRVGSKLLDRLEQSSIWRRFFRPHTITRSRMYFNRHGGWAVFLSRFLVSGLGGAVNLLAGAELYPYRYFLACDFTGETMGALIPLSLGFAFGVSWEAVGDVLGTISLFTVALLIVLVLLYRLVRYLQRLKQAEAARVGRSANRQSLPAGTAAPVIDPQPPIQPSGQLPPL